ncbi:M4 family metallopeptidase [Streptomyces sp. CC219B]|nr:M4 family metallopeptidase [Streptomyces sp. CC219B]
MGDVRITDRRQRLSARTATLMATGDLYGSGSAEYNAVAAAWKAVNVN